MLADPDAAKLRKGLTTVAGRYPRSGLHVRERSVATISLSSKVVVGENCEANP